MAVQRFPRADMGETVATVGGVSEPTTSVVGSEPSAMAGGTAGGMAGTTSDVANLQGEDAKQIIQATLDRYGLGELAVDVWGMYSRGSIDANTDIDTIGSALANTDMYKRRFPANAQRRAQGLPELSVSEYIGMERGYKAAMAGSGLPAGFYDSPDDFSNFIARDISAAELQTRVNQGFRAVTEANPDVIRQMKELYGVDEGGVAAFFLDPERATPVLTRQARAAQIAAQASRTGAGQITAAQAEDLARLDVSEREAQAGFAQIAAQEQLTQPLMGEEGVISREEQIAATFGANEAARQRIETRRRRRAAEFETGGTIVGGTQGVSGIAQ